MNFELSPAQLEELVSRIVMEVNQKLQYDQENDENVSGVVALMTSYIPSKHACSSKLVEMYGAGIDCALFENVNFKAPGFFTFDVLNGTEKKSESRFSNARTAQDGAVNHKMGATVHATRVKDKMVMTMDLLNNRFYVHCCGGEGFVFYLILIFPDLRERHSLKSLLTVLMH